jgi:hypothetical protein
MDFLYSLYDALVSINVPGDKARAVVDAMERDMGTTLATKSDLKQEIASLRQELKQEIALLRQDLSQEIVLVRKDMELLRSSMTIRLGSMLFVGLGLLFAALRLT